MYAVAPSSWLTSTLSLIGIPVHTPVLVINFNLEEQIKARLSALGVVKGIRLVVLRRAMLGGPLHVRLDMGAELAIDASVAKGVVVQQQTGSDSSEQLEQRAFFGWRKQLASPEAKEIGVVVAGIMQ
ncbi:FeoA family protein [Pajaroellobacter abortibovis]|uniref:Ferrous iron transporter FeoA-like domain-containing protein n=1 Tax=Pajaroellobacter abortibovis TaxID=1882918 RepID=A0A1L6MYI2_9BACT|nr:FeoA family protein [Pajaroellobacter abortibovis]APS00546.1 hypothetical protein BCY86_07550 [Pajaroellobacter abortibovis]